MPNDDRDPKDQLKEGLGLLWRAARGAATEVKKDLDRRGGVGKSLDEAGREIARAATNVLGRIGSELQKAQGPAKPAREDRDHEHDPRPPKEGDDEDRPAPEKKPRGPTKSDPGFRIAVDDQDSSDDGKPR